MSKSAAFAVGLLIGAVALYVALTLRAMSNGPNRAAPALPTQLPSGFVPGLFPPPLAPAPSSPLFTLTRPPSPMVPFLAGYSTRGLR